MIEDRFRAAVESFFVGVGAEPVDKLLATGRVRTAGANRASGGPSWLEPG